MDVFDLFGRLRLDDSEYDEGLSEAEDRTNRFASGMQSTLRIVGAAAAAAVGLAATAVGNLTKNAVEAYADYEQLVGGVETLFKDSAGIVQNYAANAYKTAGLSANEYMETVTSFSASLLQSLGGDTEKAAEIADLAITDMSDNANKMGTSMESIQNAYNGFSKQNYNMLDNLKLGYGDTRAEMERLLADAEKLSGVQYDISSLSDVYEAIHVIQTELGITGTTAKEASETIAGSIGMAKSAWQNLIVGVVDDQADFDKLIDNFVDAVTAAAKNILTNAQKALAGIGDLIRKLAPEVTKYLQQFSKDVLPDIIDAAIDLVMAVATVIQENAPTIITTLVTALVDNADRMIEAAGAIITALADGLFTVLPELLARLPELIGRIISAIKNALDGLGDMLAEKLPAFGWLFDDLGTKVEIVVAAIGAFKAAMAIKNVVELASSLLKILAGDFGTVAAQANVATGSVNRFTAATAASGVTSGISGFLGVGGAGGGQLLLGSGSAAGGISLAGVGLAAGAGLALGGVGIAALDYAARQNDVALEEQARRRNESAIDAYMSAFFETSGKNQDIANLALENAVSAMKANEWTESMISEVVESANAAVAVSERQRQLEENIASLTEAMNGVINTPQTINVQTMLDGQVLAEITTAYQLSAARAAGG